MTRILDVDLDFFLHGVAHWRQAGSGRLDAADYPPWTREDALAFLEERCNLRTPLPGIVVENHGELFERWGRAIDDGRLALPVSVTHVDAHSDLGLGDATYITLLTELLFLPVEDTCVHSSAEEQPPPTRCAQVRILVGAFPFTRREVMTPERDATSAGALRL